MSKFLGKTYNNNEGDSFIVKEKLHNGYFIVEFADGTQVISYYSNFINGKIVNYNKPRVYGVGYRGYGKFDNRKDREVYTRWVHVLERCYSERKKEECPSYQLCYTDMSWHNFQNFASDFYKLLSEGGDLSWHIDKDVLFKGNKEYSYENCILLPEPINKCFVKRRSQRGKYPIGVHLTKGKYKAQLNGSLGVYNTPEEAFEVYKTTKEAYIKTLANSWRASLSTRAYEGLMNYEVSITD